MIAPIIGATAIKADHGLALTGVMALAALAVSTSLCAYLLLTKNRLVFALDAQDVYEFLISDGSGTQALV